MSFIEAAFEGSFQFWPSSWTQFLPVREAGTRFQIKMKLCCFFARQEMGLGPGIPLLSVWASWLPVSPPPLPSPSSPLRPPPLCPSLSLFLFTSSPISFFFFSSSFKAFHLENILHWLLQVNSETAGAGSQKDHFEALLNERFRNPGQSFSHKDMSSHTVFYFEATCNLLLK